MDTLKNQLDTDFGEDDVPDEGVKIVKQSIVNPSKSHILESQNSNFQLTFQEIESRESLLTANSEDTLMNKRVSELLDGEPYFKLTKFADLVQLQKYEALSNNHEEVK